MAEEFRPDENRMPEEELLHLNIEDDLQDEADLRVTGTHKSHKKKKNKALYPVLIVLLLFVMGYSGYQIASTVIRNLKAENVYNEIEYQFVKADDETDPPAPTEPRQTAPVQTRPSADSSLEQNTEETEQPRETEETASLVTVEADPTTAVPTTAVPKTTKAPKTTAVPLDPMRLLSVDFAGLKKANKDSIAWLQGMGGNVSYPVVQGKDNEYYLKHLFDGSTNANGTLFVHCDNRFLQDDITFIFGHHMANGKMFGHLTDYRSSDYYWNNLEFRLYTPEKIYMLKIYAVVLGVGTESITLNYGSAEDFDRGMQGYAARSLHPAAVQVSYGDKMVCLCTCSHLQDDGRMFVYCKVMNPGD